MIDGAVAQFGRFAAGMPRRRGRAREQRRQFVQRYRRGACGAVDHFAAGGIEDDEVRALLRPGVFEAVHAD